MANKKNDKKFVFKIFGVLQISFKNYATGDIIIILCILPFIVILLRMLLFCLMMFSSSSLCKLINLI